MSEIGSVILYPAYPDHLDRDPPELRKHTRIQQNLLPYGIVFHK